MRQPTETTATGTAGGPDRSAAAHDVQVGASGASGPAAAPSADGRFAVEPPAIALPKGGGAIRGIGEKFAANPVTGTGSMTVPIATSPGRSGFGPELALAYDSGSGNGPFGFGWSLSIPSISRKTDKGLPLYRDGAESDVYLLSGAEDLVPVLDDATGLRHVDLEIDPDYLVHRYRPRVEGLFARIERWTRRDSGEIHWRVISRDNVTSRYGTDRQSRVFDPDDADLDRPPRIFQWLLRERFDDKGNVILYEYAAEDDAGLDPADTNEHRRSRGAARYPKRILYGNRTSRLARADWEADGWLFEVVFDYDEGHLETLPADSALPLAGQERRVRASARPTRPWAGRPDPFSTYRAGFEVRTHRRCRRVLTFHRFDELTAQTGGEPYLVRATELDYADFDYGVHGAAPPPVADELAHRGSTRFASFVQSARQSGFVYDAAAGSYRCRSLPPLEFDYSKARIDERIHTLAPADLENLPAGLDERVYRWVDLDGEGLSGILSEQGDAWLYKPNLGDGRFGPVRVLPSRPAASLSAAGQQLVDLAGDGQLDLVAFEGATPGFYARTGTDDWAGFRAFEQMPNLRFDQPNARLVDLDGDGLADLLITEAEVFTWYRSLGEAGFGPAAQVYQPEDEDRGPRLVLADATESIHLADMSGDGLPDLVRIRNGEVCYWPSLGHGRFGAKVVMDDAPGFDRPDAFDHRRIRLADIDGSGTTDILYLHPDGVRIWLNRSGNRWSAARSLGRFPPVDNLTAVTVVDLLGNGTACLVWSSPLPGDVGSPLRYIDLMGGQKPHLLIRTRNNLGLTTEIEYAPSTRFYLADRRAGTPWATRIPFPVHCVARVSVTDRWRGARFATRYSYHHGYFDGAEREFRGFGRVEQVDTEAFERFAADHAESPHVTDDPTLYQPPVKTVTWFHTGAFIDRACILSQFSQEYFPHWLSSSGSAETPLAGAFREAPLPEPTLDPDPAGLTAQEWREALRACKGMLLRQEVYELDPQALDDGVERPVKLFSAAYHNCHIRRLQPQSDNRHAVFLVTEGEAIAYHYELDLRERPLAPDPRIAHTLNLRIDDYGHVLQSVAAVYPRIGRHADATLPPGTEDLIEQVQRESHLIYTETRYTDDRVEGPHRHRLPQPCEVLTYELTGIRPPTDDSDASGPTAAIRYFTREALLRLDLSPVHPRGSEPVDDLDYHRLPSLGQRQKRLIEHLRTLYFDDALEGPAPLGTLGALALPYESYKLALTDDLLAAVLGDRLTDEVRDALGDARQSGYLSGIELRERFPGSDSAGQFWIRSGVAGFATEAEPAQHPSRHFYLPERYTDPFGNTTRIDFDPLDLFVRSTTDPLGNRVAVTAFDNRVLAPSGLSDINGNLSEVVFDALGLPAALAVEGKGSEGDRLDAFDGALIDPDPATRQAFFTGAFDGAEARRLLAGATVRHLYDFGEERLPDGTLTYAKRPAGAAAILRERHVAALAPDEESPLQVAVEYSDGGGNLLVKKAQAEPETDGGPLRWIASGKTVLNNKGKPVMQYEPYFSATEHRFDATETAHGVGVTPILYYDAPGRLIRTEHPDGTLSRVEFTPWLVRSYDANDTVLESPWYRRHGRDRFDRLRALPIGITGQPVASPDERAGWLAAQHADTPAETHLDSLGREVIAIAHNKVSDGAGGLRDDKYPTFTKLDAEGKPLWIRDARGNLVMQYIAPPKPTRWSSEPNEDIPERSVPCYDIAGNLLYQHGMDGGDRWTIADAAGQPFYAWDLNGIAGSEPERRVYRTRYDALRRPLERQLHLDGGDGWQTIERFVYGDRPAPFLSPEQAPERNLRGQLYRHYDPSGLTTNERFDFKGNLLQAARRLASAYDRPVIHWPENPPDDAFEADTFTQATAYDALDRMTRLANWHRAGRTPAVYLPRYNERGLLAGERLTVRDDPTDAIRRIDYNEKGQRARIEYGNGTATDYVYDPATFRLVAMATQRTGASPARCEADHASVFVDDAVVQDLHYWYDPVGNITQIHDDAHRVIFHAGQEIRPHNRYEYDALYRLIHATGRENGAVSGAPPQLGQRAADHPFPCAPPNAFRNYSQGFSYDDVGNIRQMGHEAGPLGSWTRNYHYADDSNRLRSTRTNNPAETVDYRYDIHGSMLNLANVPDEYGLQWDYRDMIRHVNLGGGGEAWYNYDAGKQRTRKRIRHNGTTVEERVYLGGMEWYRRWRNGSLVEEIESHHLFVEEQRALIVEDVLIADDEDLATRPLYRYQYGNHLGSVGLELDRDGAVISFEEYHPYGTTAYRANGRAIAATAKRYRYTGMERDDETGLSYHTARYYSPGLGRWISTERKTRKYAHISCYQYCFCNSINYSDTTGDDPEDDLRGRQAAQTAPSVNPDSLRTARGRFRALAMALHLTQSVPDQLQPDLQPTDPQQVDTGDFQDRVFEADADEEDLERGIDRRRERLERRAERQRQAVRASRLQQVERRRRAEHGGHSTSGERRVAGVRRGRGTYSTTSLPARSEGISHSVRGRSGGRSGGGGSVSPTVGSLLTTFGLANLATAFVHAGTSEERAQLVADFALETSAEYLAARILGAGPARVLFLQGDESPHQVQARLERRFRVEWQHHVDQVIPQLAQDLRRIELILSDISTLSGDPESDFVLASRIRGLASELSTTRQELAQHLSQLSLEDLPYVRQQLQQSGVSRDLVQSVVR